MEKAKVTRNLVVTVVLIGILIGSFYVMAAERGREAVGKEMGKSLGMPVLTGDLWQKMTVDGKEAFIWGLWHTVAIEHYLMKKYPDLKKDNFSLKVIEASDKSPLTLDQTVAMVDQYYQTNPDHLEKPVVGVLWHMAVRPNIAIGIAGRPLKPEN
ncbi:MAG: hypothetical protein HY879_01280 [Deltaproteobacteria bacterium]|nr:hypothetical protein [Deltaproteobacteria bacterium]